MYRQYQESITQLHLAIEFGLKRKAYNLIMSGIDVNSNLGGNTPLHRAVIHLHAAQLDIVKMLINKGADLHARNKDNYTPLDIAIQGDKTKFAIQLIRHGALDGEDLNPLLLEAILKAVFSKKCWSIIKTIIPFCSFSKPSDLYIPEELVRKSDLQSKRSIALLLKWNFTVHPNSHHDEDFVYGAVKNGYLSIVLQLLNSGINVNMMNSKHMVQILLVRIVV
ncbi:poly [ADP-ribose] polymerase tankyrase-2-like [Chelonus insularis]|uniref:poly [ADP-ribose] polymerase tankyrase-2-like n=1 Tax=Chelonus insularis TaxID=460826 RepID=UPI00158E78BD|nr:poly [ADP-ribose] polymerase tankyrase-2-like [Chelonus insularis]